MTKNPPLVASAGTSEASYVYSPLTMEAWAEHYGVTPRRLAGVMRQAMNDIFRGDNEITRLDGGGRELTERKALVRQKHRSERVEGNGLVIVLSQDYQSRVVDILAREETRDPKDYITLNALKMAFTDINIEELRGIIAVFRKTHPNWFCRPKHAQSGRSGTVLLRAHEKEFIAAAQPMVEQTLQKRHYREMDAMIPRASEGTGGLRGWGIEDGIEAFGLDQSALHERDYFS